MKSFALIIFTLCVTLASFAQDAVVDTDKDTLKKIESTNVKRPNWDIRLFKSINEGRKPLYDFVVPITDKAIFPAAVGVPPILFLAGRLSDHPYDENSAVISGLSALTSTAVTFGLKHTLRRERPFVTLDSSYYNDENSLTDRFSFPSGHTATAFSLATSTALRYPDNYVLISGLYLHAIAVGFGRMYLGVHYPSDVMAGAVIGAGSAILMYSLRKEIMQLKNDVFNENLKDEDTSRMNQYFILGTVILSDIVNYIFYHSTPALKKRARFKYSSDERGSYLGFSYNF
jgi:membrane-associated phospholipid phosphatase